MAPVGGSYGDMMGTGFVYHENGKIIVGEDGKPLYSDVKKLGNIMPDWLGSINNTLSFKGLEFNFLIDAKVGGDVYSRTDQDGFVTGVLENIPGVIGSSVTRAPVTRRMALPLAPGGGIIGTSPTPRTPKGCPGYGTSTMIVSMGGISRMELLLNIRRNLFSILLTPIPLTNRQLSAISYRSQEK